MPGLGTGYWAPMVCLAVMPVCWVRILEAVGEHGILKENKARPTRGDKKINKKVNSLFQGHQVLESPREGWREGERGEGKRRERGEGKGETVGDLLTSGLPASHSGQISRN